MRKLIFSTLVGLAACSPYSPDLGSAPYLCNAEDMSCPDGYSCQPSATQMVCVSSEGLGPDAMQMTFPCANDSTFEGGARNDTKETAYQSPVDSQRLDLTLAGLAICPEGDKDHYAVTVSSKTFTDKNNNLEVVASWDSGAALSMSILNTVGTSIGAATSNGEKSIRACLPNMPVGTYYVAVFGADSTKNNYRLAVKLKANCNP